MALSYWREKKLPVIVGRLFNTAGPRQTGRYGMVLPSFVRQALAEAPITVFGSGQQSRCFCDVRDTIEAIMRLTAKDRAVGEVVNIGNDEEISIENLARLVKQRARSTSRLTYIPYDQAYEPGFEDTTRRVPSLSKLQSLTAFRPARRLVETVDHVIAYFRGQVEVEFMPAARRMQAAGSGVRP